jgi:hypothetical protein
VHPVDARAELKVCARVRLGRRVTWEGKDGDLFGVE